MKFSNLHQHSTFSDGKSTPEEIVLFAIENQMESIGFSDHRMTPFEVTMGYNCVTKETYAKYTAEIERLKQKYSDKITLFKGIEADAFCLIDGEVYDYVIGSVHYLEANGKTYPIDHTARQQMEYVNEACNGDFIKFAQDYYNQVVDCIKKFKPDIIGHFDVITKFSLIDENNPTYQEIAKKALRECAKITNLIEVNTGAISRGYKTLPYPADFLLKEALNLKMDVILSSDSHNKNTVICNFNESIELLKKIGFTHIAKLTKNGFIKENI